MSATPENTQLPRYLDPRKFAQKGLEVEGLVPLKELSRISELALDASGSVSAKLEFGIDEERMRMITGTVSGGIPVSCQRCLEPMTVDVSAELNLAIVWDEEAAKKLPKRLEPLIVGEGSTDIYNVIEDEILLNLPMVSYHDHECLNKTSFGDDKVEESLKEEKNPFQILEQLKGSPKS